VATQTQRVPAQPGTARADGAPGARRTPIVATRADQRSRLLAAIIEIVARTGYPDTKVADVVRYAGVSRATFYQLFENKEACLLAAQSDLGTRVALEVEQAVMRGAPGRAAQSAIVALAELAGREPLVFDFLMHASMLGGATAQAERDRLLGRFEHAIEAAWEQAPSAAPLLDIPARFVLEGAIRLLGLRMRRDGDAPRTLLADLLTWVDGYTVSAGPARWRSLRPEAALLDKHAEHPGTMSLRPSLPKGRHRMGAEVARSVQRERITYATAEAIRAKGYAELRVADIVATAGLSRDAFYARFHDKDEAFDGAAQLVFEHLLARMAGAFFGDAGSWADQLWEAGWAFEQFLEDEPSLAHFLFIATYAPPPRIGRVLDFVLAFTLFVEGGNRERPQGSQVPVTVTEAIVCAVLEAVNFYVRHNRVQELRGLVPAITYMVFAPFMGTEEARAFVEAKVRAEEAVVGEQA
jgi:AcrR family transcriptional regulator